MTIINIKKNEIKRIISGIINENKKERLEKKQRLYDEMIEVINTVDLLECYNDFEVDISVSIPEGLPDELHKMIDEKYKQRIEEVKKEIKLLLEPVEKYIDKNINGSNILFDLVKEYSRVKNCKKIIEINGIFYLE
jgi:hypothetical protein